MAAMELAARERAPTTAWDAENESLRSYFVGLAGVPLGPKNWPYGWTGVCQR